MKETDLGKLIKNLPAGPGIIGKDEYFNSAVLIPLIKADKEYYFLFEKRSAKIRQGGEVCFPGGEFDKKTDPDFKETAIRETEEELGISRDKINIIGQLDTFVGPMGVTVDSFIGEIKINSLDEFTIDKNEVEKVFTIPVSFFANNKPEEYQYQLEMHPHYIDEKGEKVELFPVEKLGLPLRYSKPRKGKNHKVYIYKTEPEIVWGITAALIREFIHKLNYKT